MLNDDVSKKITHAAIIPLIGGQTIGVMDSFNTNPEYIISFDAFKENDSNLLHYFKTSKNVDMPYYVFDKNENNIDNLKYVDVVHSVCPCAGLSTLNTSKNNRGHDSNTNDWMYIAANLVLKNVKPLVYFGENAPGLSQKSGRPVAKKLAKIAKENGYSFSMYRTKSIYHNNPQKRLRTFYFFWNNKLNKNGIPKLNFIKNNTSNIDDYIKQFTTTTTANDNLNILVKKYKPSETLIFDFIITQILKQNRNNFSYEKFMKENIKDKYYRAITALTYVQKEMDVSMVEAIKRVIDYGENVYKDKIKDTDSIDKYEKDIKRYYRLYKKLSNGGKIMNQELIFANNIIPTLTWKTCTVLCHPYEDRFFTIRELMNIMGLPQDFTLHSKYIEDKNENFIINKAIKFLTQNVPSMTVKDIADNILLYLNGKLELIDVSKNMYIVQNNSSEKREEILEFTFNDMED